MLIVVLCRDLYIFKNKVKFASRFMSSVQLSLDVDKKGGKMAIATKFIFNSASGSTNTRAVVTS